ncbi:MAG: 16S rRNA (guanine(966)-N(2))-methyltransferase RsmD [Erysipelotrichaceae bacterium]
MKIVAGKHRSRIINSIESNTTRPTASKIKEAVFSKIGPYFAGGTMLDLFAGSGSIGLEGISRGIEHCYFFDNNSEAIKMINSNITNLHEENTCSVFKLDYKASLKYCLNNNLKFDIIYLDPPYLEQEIAYIMEFIATNKLLNTDGYIVVESLKNDSFGDNYSDIYKLKESKYGITKITYYRKDEEDE